MDVLTNTATISSSVIKDYSVTHEPVKPASPPVAEDPNASLLQAYISCKVAEMQYMVDEFTKGLAPCDTVQPSTHSHWFPAGDVVLITGTTGGLGSSMVSDMLARDDVRRVYALNRPGRAQPGAPVPTLKSRQQTAFTERQLDPALVDHEKLVLLEGNTAEAKLGLPDAVYEEVCFQHLTVAKRTLIV
jgi:hypothetical protein